MGLFSNRVEKSELKAGDHIYAYRASGIYSHHGIYIGEGRVIHFTSSNLLSSTSISKSKKTCSTCGYEYREGGVFKCCLDCFLKNGKLYRYRYGVDDVIYWATYMCRLRGGTCNTAESDPAEVVIGRAKNLLENGFGKYNMINHNCEDFATVCKTGQDCSRNGKFGGHYGQSSLFGALFPNMARTSLH